LPIALKDQRWLVTGLWSEQAVGIIGGEPKCCKSFLALDLAVAVAAGVPCLRRFAVPRAGRVLLYAAEDALHIVRRRLDGICAAAGLGLADLDVQVITAPTVRLDLEADRRSLDATVAEWRPRLLVLDPFVRLHRIDENASGEGAPRLAYLRELQRRHAIAVIVVHHAKKGAGHVRAGQALRGSSEFHAWGDSNLYLRRNRDPRENGDITLTVEHRAAPAMPSVTLELAQRANALALEVIEPRTPQTPTSSSVDERITAALTDVNRPLPFAELRARCRVRTATLYERLATLTAAGRLASPTKVIASPVADRARATISREHSHNRQHDIAPAARFRFQLSPQRGGSGSGKVHQDMSLQRRVPGAPSFCSIAAILPSRPARATCQRAQRRSGMARLRATASAARSVLDGREHDGRLHRVGAAISLPTSTPSKGVRERPSKNELMLM
jgi:hypothetical protein